MSAGFLITFFISGCRCFHGRRFPEKEPKMKLEDESSCKLDRRLLLKSVWNYLFLFIIYSSNFTSHVDSLQRLDQLIQGALFDKNPGRGRGRGKNHRPTTVVKTWRLVFLLQQTRCFTSKVVVFIILFLLFLSESWTQWDANCCGSFPVLL